MHIMQTKSVQTYRALFNMRVEIPKFPKVLQQGVFFQNTFVTPGIVSPGRSFKTVTSRNHLVFETFPGNEWLYFQTSRYKKG